MNKLKILSATICLTLAGISFAQADMTKVSVSNAWVKAMPPSVRATAAYMHIHNESRQDVVLTEVETDVAETAEIHTMSNTDGVMRMKHIPELIIQSTGTTVLQPGGFHVMLIGLLEPLNPGQQVELILTFEDGSQKVVEAVVRHPLDSEKKGSDKGSHKGSHKGSKKGSMH